MPQSGSRGVGDTYYDERRRRRLILARLPNGDFHRVGYFESIHSAASHLSTQPQEFKIVKI
jgi:hypothetical protein